MKKNILRNLSLVSLVFGLVTFTFPLILPEDTINYLVHEDSVIEYLGAIFFFMGGIFFLLSFFSSQQGNRFWKIKTNINLFYLFLCLILIFGAGEEISWGQRLFGFKTPQSLVETNVQAEFTVHNLPAFDPTNTDSLFNMNKMFIYFWFLFGIGIPVIVFLSKWLKKQLEVLGFPLVPLWLGMQFILFYFMSKLYEPLGAVRDIYEGRIVEFRETQHALIFMLIALYFLLKERDQKQVRSN